MEPGDFLALRNRIASFTGKISWPHSSPSPERVAAAGFYFAPTKPGEDDVACPSCAVIVAFWAPDDDPFNEHLSANPKCNFAKRLLRELQRAEERKMKRQRSRAVAVPSETQVTVKKPEDANSVRDAIANRDKKSSGSPNRSHASSTRRNAAGSVKGKA